MKRIYWQTILKKALEIGIPVGIAGFALLFIYLSALGVIDVTGYSGDMVCAGTVEDPCLAFINFTAKEDIFIYPVGYDPWGRNTSFYTDVGLKSWKMYRSWGTGWREIKLNETCQQKWCGAPYNNMQDNKYAFAFREDRDYQIRIVALKEDPTQDIKWGFGPVDPIWYGTNKYNVSFEFSKNSIIEKCLDIQIQNLQDSSDNLDLKTILNETNFDVNQASNIQFYEWKSEEVLKNIYEQVCNPYNETGMNGTYLVTNCSQIITGNYTEEVWNWKYKNLLTTDKDKTELRNTWEQVSIQKAGNIKDTIKFRLCFGAPIIETNGWGNAGTIYLDLNGEMFVDKTNSSWWNETWNKKKEINITKSNLPSNYTLILDVKKETDMNSNYSDLRFLNNSETGELNYWVEIYNTTEARVYVKVQNNLSISMYYNNTEASDKSDIFNAFLFYDDFNRDSIGSNWSCSGTTTVSSGNMSIDSGNCYVNLPYVLSERNISMTSEWYFRTGTADYQQMFWNRGKYWNGAHYNRNHFEIGRGGSEQEKTLAFTSYDPRGLRLNMTQDYYNTNLTMFADSTKAGEGQFIYNHITSPSGENGQHGLMTIGIGWGGGVAYDFKIRKIVLPEPTITFGGVETPPDPIYPISSNYEENPPNNTIYSLGAIYKFNATITYTNGTAGLEFEGTNYSATNLSSIFNVSVGDLAAGTYAYYWWAYGNGTKENYNISQERSYTIAKITPVITKKLNGVDDNLVVQFPQQINATASTDVGTLAIYRDGTDITSENGLNVSLGSGYYLYGFNVTFENNQNHSNLSEELYVNVTQATGEVFMWINNLRSNFSVEIPNNRNIWLNATLNVGIGDIELRLNGSVISSGSSPLSNLTNLSLGFYNATAVYPETQNYSSGREIWWINVSGIESVNFSLEGYFYDLDVELGKNITINATTNTLKLVCMDIDHPEYGVNYSCLDWETSFELVINYFRKLIFSDGSSEKIFNFSSLNTSIDRGNLSISSHRYDEVDGLKFNISGVGDPRDIFFYLVNTSTVDRAYQGRLIGGNICQDKFYSGLNYSNLSYSNPGESITYIYLDDNAKVSNFTLKVTGVEYGFDYFDDLDDFDYIDKSLTTAQLDKSGTIMLANSSLTEFVFDDFEDDSISDHWSYDPDYNTPPITETTTEVDGVLRQFLSFSGVHWVGDREKWIVPNTSHMNLYSSEEIKIGLYSTYEAYEDNSGCTGYSYVSLGGDDIWASSHVNSLGGSDEDAAANMSFIFTKHNKTSWRVQIDGFERSYASDLPAPSGCGYMEGKWNWTAGTYYISKADCADDSGSLDNDFYANVNYLDNAINVRSTVSYGSECEESEVINQIYYVNNSKWYRSNATVVSKSVFDSSSDIAKSTLSTFIGDFGAGVDTSSLFMSADDGVNWESVEDGVEYSFSNPGKHVKWKINMYTTTPGFPNDTFFLMNTSVSTQKGFPANITFDFGDDDTIDYFINGTLNSTNSPYSIELTNADFSGALIPTYQFYNHAYAIPLIVGSDSKGQINLGSLNLTYDPNPVILDTDYIQDFLDLFNGIVNFSIPFRSEYSEGNITISNLNFDYAGGNDTISILAHSPDYSINLSRTLTYFYSDFYKNLPYSWTDSIFFLPRTNSSKNVSAYGQQDSTPLFNVTTTNYCGRKFNMSIRLNESFSCLNITWNSTGSTKPDDQKVNISWQEIFVKLEYLNNSQIWFWADLENCNPTNKRILNPEIELKSYCEGCVWS